jgi:hypothetical protein
VKGNTHLKELYASGHSIGVESAAGLRNSKFKLVVAARAAQQDKDHFEQRERSYSHQRCVQGSGNYKGARRTY